MAFFRVRMQSPAASPMDSSFFRPLERNQMHVGSSLPLRSVLDKVMSEPTLIEYTDNVQKNAAPHWLSPNYIDLHLRTARIVSCEAKSALHRHFVQPRKRPTAGELRKDNDDGSLSPILEERHESLIMDWMLAGNRSFLEECFC